jgi:hypothetical protein
VLGTQSPNHNLRGGDKLEQDREGNVNVIDRPLRCPGWRPSQVLLSQDFE